MEIQRKEYERRADQQDTDHDGLPDRADATPKGQDFYYKKVDSEQLAYLNDFADFPFTAKNGIVQIQSEDKESLLQALERQAHLLNLHDKP
ncbi:MAG: hypothetical protein IKQ91_01655 [Oscillospiraceae bacterium]|nr:hypothetical protein [Oscillospiraceae bacterium]MBR3448418.1 hypothetical protein [Oscillospiraceae bacterium]MBR4199967.1 hypothetical protein [Oscillospiraceae bacterium]